MEGSKWFEPKYTNKLCCGTWTFRLGPDPKEGFNIQMTPSILLRKNISEAFKEYYNEDS